MRRIALNIFQVSRGSCFQLILSVGVYARDSTELRSFKVFRFPADKIPTINGETQEWEMVPQSYVVGMEELWEDSGKHPDPFL